MSESYFMGLDGFVWFTGVVENRQDPAKLGRVQVRCLGFHSEKLTDIPTEDLPWAHVMHPVTDPSMQGLGNTPSFLVEGTWVVGFFRDAVEKQQPVIMGTLPGYPSATPDTTKGFNDPNGKYPSLNTRSGHDINESDVNRLARNDALAHVVLTTKNSTVTTQVPTANTDVTWDEPSSAHNSTYPFNHVYETESGHIIEYDDTEDNERIHEYHRAGTFYEIDRDGNKVTRIVGNNYEIIAQDNYINVKGSVNLTVDADCKTYIKGNWDIQVDGNKTEVIKGTSSETVTGAVTETYSSNQTTTVTGTVDINADAVDVDADRIDLN